MAIEDVIRDLTVYFDSIDKPVQFRAHIGGHVNPSYLTITHGARQNIIPFWSVTSGSDREKQLAVAFKEDIEAWLNRPETKPCPEVSASSPSTTKKREPKSKPVRSLTD